MSDPYTDRCKILEKWLAIRNAIGDRQYMGRNMPNSHPEYAIHVNMLGLLCSGKIPGWIECLVN
jgi:hypothetical protein